MGQALSVPLRKKIVLEHAKGASVTSLSAKYSVSRRSIYNYIKSYKAQGEEGLQTDYSNCGRKRLTEKDLIYRVIRCFRCWHPSWGAEKIRAEILFLRPNFKLPTTRTIHHWLVWNGQVKPKTRLPKDSGKWAKNLHEGWQIDAKEELEIKDGSRNSWLNVVDEHSGTVIDPPLFPLQENK